MSDEPVWVQGLKQDKLASLACPLCGKHSKPISLTPPANILSYSRFPPPKMLRLIAVRHPVRPPPTCVHQRAQLALARKNEKPGKYTEILDEILRFPFA